MAKVTRGRLSSFQLLPTECDAIVSWAAQELAANERNQTDIYAEFVGKCEALMAEHRGELEFTIPALSSFNRYSMRLAKLTQRLNQTREIVSALSPTFNAKDSDDLTILTAETIKALVLHMLGESADGIEPKDAMHLAAAFKNATAAQSMSSDRRAKVEAAFAARVGTAVETVAKAKGLTAETVEAIKGQILGVS